MSHAIKMAVVDDDPDICDTLREYFLLKGFEVATALNGLQFKELLGCFVPHIVILDITMPGEDGFVLARYLYEHTDAAVIMLTGSKNPVDMIVGLEVGADDFVTKPVDLRALEARIKSVLRRTLAGTSTTGSSPKALQQANVSSSVNLGSLVNIGKCVFNVAQGKLWHGDQEVELTSKEYDLLLVLLANPNVPMSRDQLLALEHKDNSESFDRSIDSRITRLRKKIELNPEKPVAIKTVRNVGYVFTPSAPIVLQ